MIFIRTLFRAEAAGNLLLHFAESDRAFRFVVGKRHLPIPGEKQNVFLVIPQALQKTDYFPFRNTSTLPGWLPGYGILGQPIGNNPVISQKISLQNTFLEAGLTHSGILLPAAQDFEQQFLHLLCPDLVFFFLCLYQFPQNMRIAQAVSGCFIAVVRLPEVMYHGVRKAWQAESPGRYPP